MVMAAAMTYKYLVSQKIYYDDVVAKIVIFLLKGKVGLCK